MFRDGIIFKTYSGIRQLLNRTQLSKTRLVVLLLTLLALADVVGISSVVPVLMLAIDHSFLEKSSKLRNIYEWLDFHTEADFLWALIIVIFVFYLLKNIFAIWLHRFIRRISQDINRSLTQGRYMEYFHQNDAGSITGGTSDFVDHVLYDPLYFVTGVFFPWLTIISELVVVALITLVFTVYQPLVFLLVICVLGPAFFLVNRFTRNRRYRIGVEGSDYRQQSLAMIDFGPSGFFDIKSNQKEQFFLDKFLHPQGHYAKSSLRGLTYQLLPSRANEMVTLVGIIILVIYGYFYSANVGQTRVIAALFVLTVFRLIPAANRLLQGLMQLKLNHYTIQHLTRPLGSAGNSAEQTEAPAFSEIRLDNLGFTYPGNSYPALDDIHLVIPKGSITGITGPSGSGKSTLVYVLLRMLKENSGCIYAGDTCLKDSHRSWWLKRVAYVGQQPFVLHGSIAENVAFGLNPGEWDAARIDECLQMASLTEFAGEQNRNRDVGIRGTKLSEGQKQRLMLARALYRNSELLILDEPTSALDSANEQTVLQTIDRLRSHVRAIVVISHQKTTLAHCDRILVMHKGKLTEETQ